MEDIWAWAQAAGFADLHLAAFSTDTHHVSLADFNAVVAGGEALNAYTRKVRGFLCGHRSSFRQKPLVCARQPRTRRPQRRNFGAPRAHRLASRGSRFAARQPCRTSARPHVVAWFL